MFKEIIKTIKSVLVIMTKSYQLTRCVRSSCCRFYPSCSDYFLQAIEKRGIIKAIILTATRLLKCHPWHEGGIDYFGLS